MKRKRNLGPLEHKIMDIVWKLDSATVYDVVAEIEKDKELAYTTVMTVMARLAEKGILSRKKDGKTYIYSPKQSKEKFVHTLVQNTITKLVDSFGETAVAAFVDEAESLSKEHRQELVRQLQDDT